ncbi:MAG: hypothetical protein AAFQ89_06910 [Cyanobacteria bacterium J06626_18]
MVKNFAPFKQMGEFNCWSNASNLRFAIAKYPVVNWQHFGRTDYPSLRANPVI